MTWKWFWNPNWRDDLTEEAALLRVSRCPLWIGPLMAVWQVAGILFVKHAWVWPACLRLVLLGLVLYAGGFLMGLGMAWGSQRGRWVGGMAAAVVLAPIAAIAVVSLPWEWAVQRLPLTAHKASDLSDLALMIGCAFGVIWGARREFARALVASFKGR